MNRRLLGPLLALFLLVVATASADRASAGPLPAGDTGSWPLGPPRPQIVRGWEPPASAYGRGHRGIDLAAAPGAPVRAAAPGRVSFAGKVAGRGVLTISLTGTGDPPLRTTYEPVTAMAAVGTQVSAGEVVGHIATGPSHCAVGCLHWGLLRGTAYLDPLSLLPPRLLHRGPSRLLPVLGVPEPAAGAVAEPAAEQAAEPVSARAMGSAGALHTAALLVTAALVHGGLRRWGPGPARLRRARAARSVRRERRAPRPAAVRRCTAARRSRLRAASARGRGRRLDHDGAHRRDGPASAGARRDRPAGRPTFSSGDKEQRQEPGARAGKSRAQPRTPRSAMDTAASATDAGSSAAPSSIRRTAASTTPCNSIAASRGCS